MGICADGTNRWQKDFLASLFKPKNYCVDWQHRFTCLSWLSQFFRVNARDSDLVERNGLGLRLVALCKAVDLNLQRCRGTDPVVGSDWYREHGNFLQRQLLYAVSLFKELHYYVSTLSLSTCLRIILSFIKDCFGIHQNCKFNIFISEIPISVSVVLCCRHLSLQLEIICSNHILVKTIPEMRVCIFWDVTQFPRHDHNFVKFLLVGLIFGFDWTVHQHCVLVPEYKFTCFSF